jgi:hypothetical protein
VVGGVIDDYTIEVIVLFLLALAAPSVIWFYRIRRFMIERQKMVVEALEAALRPKDKNYTLIGYLVGFRADYILDGEFSRAWILYTTPPHHVFFYLPVILAAREKERLSLTLKPRGQVAYTVHVLRTGDRWALRTFTIDYGSEALRACGHRDLYIVCGSPTAVERVMELAKSLEAYGAKLARATVDHTKNVVHVQAVIEGASPYHVVEEVLRFARRMTVW